MTIASCAAAPTFESERPRSVLPGSPVAQEAASPAPEEPHGSIRLLAEYGGEYGGDAIAVPESISTGPALLLARRLVQDPLDRVGTIAD
ncbi:MAG: hypothetical protein ACI8Q9_000150 [Planctomycetota bacterium]|jgi:hypothetical protein